MTASQAKKIGRTVMLPSHWDDCTKQTVMTFLVGKKFFENKEFSKMLIDTGTKLLEERNSWNDRYWGVDEDGIGRNELGKILMSIRELIKC